MGRKRKDEGAAPADPLSQPVLGAAEMAQVLGWPRSTVNVYHSRGKLPAPLATLSCGPIWRREDVLAFVAQRNGEAEAPAATVAPVKPEPAPPRYIEASDDVKRRLEAEYDLPPEMRILPGYVAHEAALEARVRPMLRQRMWPVFDEGMPIAEIVDAAVADGGHSLTRALLAGSITRYDLWPTLKALVDQGASQLSTIAEAVQELASADGWDVREAGDVEDDIVRIMERADVSYHEAERKWLKQDRDHSNEYPRWHYYGGLAERIHQVRNHLMDLLMREVRPRLLAEVEAEAERLAVEARTEAPRRRRPIDVAARWLSPRSKRRPALHPDILRLVAYELAKRLIN